MSMCRRTINANDFTTNWVPEIEFDVPVNYMSQGFFDCDSFNVKHVCEQGFPFHVLSDSDHVFSHHVCSQFPDPTTFYCVNVHVSDQLIENHLTHDVIRPLGGNQP